jgi:hypothetical protein
LGVLIFCGAVERGGDMMIVILRVGLVFGIPRSFLGEDRLAIDDGGDLVITGSEVEADAQPLR